MTFKKFNSDIFSNSVPTRLQIITEQLSTVLTGVISVSGNDASELFKCHFLMLRAAQIENHSLPRRYWGGMQQSWLDSVDFGSYVYTGIVSQLV